MKAVEEVGDWRVNGQRSQERVDAAGVVRVCVRARVRCKRAIREERLHPKTISL